MEENQKRQFSIHKTVSTIGVLFLLVTTTALGSSPLLFINIPSIIFVFGLTFFMLLGAFGKDFLKFIPDSILTLFSTPHNQLNSYAEIALHGSRYSIGAAVIITVIGFIQALAGLDDPDSITISLAISILPIFYALLASEIFFAILYVSYSSRNEGKGKPNRPISLVNIFLPVAILGFIFMTTFELLMFVMEFNKMV